MMRVAFFINSFGAGWLGGINYYRSLFYALSIQPDRPIEPVLVVPFGAGGMAKIAFPEIQIFETKLVKFRHPAYILRKVIQKTLKRDLLLEIFLKRNGIKAASHGPILGRKSKIPAITWIPDFQHLHLPQFFSPQELAHRNKDARFLGEYSSRIIVSSQNACNDLAGFMPDALSKVAIINFVPAIDTSSILDFDKLVSIYPIVEDYIFLPNQFWAHKNHKLVLEALVKLKQEGVKVRIISTGATNDHRNPDHFNEIKSTIENNQLGEIFNVFGVVPYAHMLSLMYYSIGLINPSHFEGWSTTVEEAKLLGKTILLSDIAVHREQVLVGGIFFDPNSAQDCGEKIKLFLASNRLPLKPLREIDRTAKERSLAFGQQYINLVKDTVSHFSGK